jgi:hypothetical protein
MSDAGSRAVPRSTVARLLRCIIFSGRESGLGLNIPGAVIPRSVFTQAGSKPAEAGEGPARLDLPRKQTLQVTLISSDVALLAYRNPSESCPVTRVKQPSSCRRPPGWF